MSEKDTSLRPRPGETAEDTLARVVNAVRAETTYYSGCLDCEVTWEEKGGKSMFCPECGSRNIAVSDEPPGAGADPFGRPDPRTSPEYWTE